MLLGIAEANRPKPAAGGNAAGKKPASAAGGSASAGPSSSRET